LQAKYQVPELERSFTSDDQVREWLRSEGVEASWGGFEGDEFQRVGDTLKDIEQKVGGLLPIKYVNGNKWGHSSFARDAQQINIDGKDNADWVRNKTLDVIDNELFRLGPGPETGYKRRLKEQKELLLSGAYHEGHTAYWFGNDRHIEAVVRHEMGHAFHNRYSDLSATDTRGYVVGIDDLRREAVREGGDREWRDDYGITARGRDTWAECVAENFVAWSVGRTDLMNPKMVNMFDLIAEQKREQRTIVEGARGG